MIDQNGTGGHCVFIDAGRKVIIDPANKKEIHLTLWNLFECAGPCSLTLAFCRVLKIHLPDRNRKEDKTRSKRKRKRQKKRLELSSNPPSGGECFLVKVDGKDNVFQRGLMSMPIELSQHNYQGSFNELVKVGMICRTTYAPMTILGSTIGASLDDLFSWMVRVKGEIFQGETASVVREVMDFMHYRSHGLSILLINQMPLHMSLP